MKLYSPILITLLLSASALTHTACSQKLFRNIGLQTELLLQEIEKADKGEKNNLVMPRTIENGELHLVRTADWTSGFFPGVLWQLYAVDKDQKWLQAAKRYTAELEKEQFNTRTHDIGFIINCSFGNGYKLTGSEEYGEVMIQAAKSLSKRFNPTIGAIRSWDHNTDKWQYPVIIDNMMNLELLFEATKLSGDSSYYRIAVSHADVTLKNHFRPDYSSFHVVDYSPDNGSIRSKATHQGYNDESAWARGQAWAVYGYTLMYRETKNPTYLKQAEGVANFILNHPNLPEDKVPYWDFNDPAIPNTPRDASAAAIIASTLYELDAYSENHYRKSADAILASLTTIYRSEIGENRGFILDHSTGHKPKDSEVDVPINYADYYYLEALLRQKNPTK